MENNQNTNEVTTNQNQEQAQQAAPQQPAAQQAPEEKKEGLLKRGWNKVKKPLGIAAAVAGGVVIGVVGDKLLSRSSDSNQVDAGTAGSSDQQSTGTTTE